MQMRQAPDANHTDSDGDNSHYRAAENIDEAHRLIMLDGQRELRVKEQACGQRAGGGGQQRGKQAIPQRRVVTAG